MSEKLARIISILFHPVVVPTLGVLLLMNSGFYYSMISWEARRYVLLVVFFTTSILPMLAVSVMALSPRFDVSMQKSHDRVIPLLSSSVFYYIGFMLLSRLHPFPVFKLYLIASVLVIIVLLLVSFKWKISVHMAALGALTGALLALSFRSGANPLWSIVGVILVSGMVGTARLVNDKHDLWQVVTGYVVGVAILYPVVYFI